MVGGTPDFAQRRVDPTSTAAVVAVGRTPPDVVGAVRAAGLEPVELGSSHGAGTSNPAVVVVATEQVDPAALATVRELRADLARTPIVVGATSVNSQAALVDGPDAVVAARDLAAALPLVIEAARLGYSVLPRRGATAAKPLSARERQALAMVMLGLSNRAIGQKLHLSESTVKSHLSSAFAKLGVRSRAEAAALLLADDAAAAGILSLPGVDERLTFERRVRVG